MENNHIADAGKKVRLISLDEALKATHSEIYWTESQQAAVRSFLVQQPRVDAVEVVHGEWIWTKEGEADWQQYWVCSECSDVTFFRTNYCPNCGAKMDKENL